MRGHEHPIQAGKEPIVQDPDEFRSGHIFVPATDAKLYQTAFDDLENAGVFGQQRKEDPREYDEHQEYKLFRGGLGPRRPTEVAFSVSGTLNLLALVQRKVDSLRMKPPAHPDAQPGRRQLNT